jgi:hypothetical protein
MIYTRSSTVSMPVAPIVDVPTTIKISGEIKSVFSDPSSVDGHFGETPIYAAMLQIVSKSYLKSADTSFPFDLYT